MGLALGFLTAPARAQLTDNPGSAADPLPTGPQATPGPTLPESNVPDVSAAAGSTKTRPAFRLLPQFVPGSEDWSRPYADVLNTEYDKWSPSRASARHKLTSGSIIPLPAVGTKGAGRERLLSLRNLETDTHSLRRNQHLTSHQAISVPRTPAAASRLRLITFERLDARQFCGRRSLTRTHFRLVSWLS
jgi:hypothetical protein